MTSDLLLLSLNTVLIRAIIAYFFLNIYLTIQVFSVEKTRVEIE